MKTGKVVVQRSVPINLCSMMHTGSMSLEIAQCAAILVELAQETCREACVIVFAGGWKVTSASLCSLRYAIATSAPSRANARATARPIPLSAPEISVFCTKTTHMVLKCQTSILSVSASHAHITAFNSATRARFSRNWEKSIPCPLDVRSPCMCHSQSRDLDSCVLPECRQSRRQESHNAEYLHV